MHIPTINGLDKLQGLVAREGAPHTHKTTKAAGQFSFGMNMQEKVYYQEGINDFASAHTVSVATVMGLQQQNAQCNQILPAMQQQMTKAMCTQLAIMHMANTTTNIPPMQAYQQYGS